MIEIITWIQDAVDKTEVKMETSRLVTLACVASIVEQAFNVVTEIESELEGDTSIQNILSTAVSSYINGSGDTPVEGLVDSMFEYVNAVSYINKLDVSLTGLLSSLLTK